MTGGHGSRIGWWAGVALLVLGGCADEIDHSEFSVELCSFGSLTVLAQTAPAEPVDGSELRDAWQTDNPDDPDGWMALIPETSGEPCAGASDREACEEAYAMLPYESVLTVESLGVVTHRTLAYGRADEVGVVASIPELLEYLGPIDAPGDAALLAMLEGHILACTEGNDVGTRPDGTFTVHTRSGGCRDDTEEHMLLVHPDGTIETEVSELIEEGDPSCSG